MSRDFYKIEAKTAPFCEKFHNIFFLVLHILKNLGK